VPSPAVFLDRDGVINEPVVRNGRPYPPRAASDLVILPEVVAACDVLRSAGFALVVVTNQPDVARGTLTNAAVTAIHEELRRQVQVTAVYTCPHDDADDCPCRKPRPGMLLQAAEDLDLDLRSSYLVGDRWRDVEAGQRAGCRTVHLDRGYSEKAPIGADMVVGGFPEAGRWILVDSQRTEDAERHGAGYEDEDLR
jgi:D-glycero-D-manno-heptose 1,7-bisphosphate phosphatase